MRTALLPLAIAVALSGASALADMPRYDVEAHCTEIAGFGGTYSHSLFNGCMDQEQSAYDTLKEAWSTLPAEIRAHCDEIAAFSSPGSYALLQGCVQMERSAGQQRKTFQY